MDDNEPLSAGKQVKGLPPVGILCSLGLGLVLGFLAKYLDSAPVIGEIGTYLGFWVLIASLLVVFSRSPWSAALNVLVFFLSMLVAYYAYSMKLFGFFPRRYFLAWGAISLFSPFGAYILWYARRTGWAAAICAAMPVSVLLREGYSFFYTYGPARGFDILAAVVLLLVLARGTDQRLRTALAAVILFFILMQLPIFSWLLGGL